MTDGPRFHEERFEPKIAEESNGGNFGRTWDFVDPPQEKARGVPLTFFEDLSDKPAMKAWVIKNVIARDETSSWIAPPGKGKSALLTDIAIHSSAGRDWRGYRTKSRTGVVYFALERADLVRRRLIAHKQRDRLGALPIAVTGQVIDLLNRSCVDAILATLSQAEDRFGCEIGLAIFDTYAKGIAAGSGDEDKAKDQNIVQANLRRLFDRGRHIHIAGVGHTGKNESKGERGSNARLADVDLQVQISGDAIKTVTVTKANDQPEGVLTAFKLEPFDFGVDDDGDPFRTFILSPEVFAGETRRSRRLSDRQVLALRALSEVTLSKGQEPPSDYQLPSGIKVVTAEAWREELYRCNALDRDAANPRARFKELRAQLAARCLIGSKDDVVWPIRPS
jgi:AAA domain